MAVVIRETHYSEAVIDNVLIKTIQMVQFKGVTGCVCPPPPIQEAGP